MLRVVVGRARGEWRDGATRNARIVIGRDTEEPDRREKPTRNVPTTVSYRYEPEPLKFDEYLPCAARAFCAGFFWVARDVARPPLPGGIGLPVLLSEDLRDRWWPTHDGTCECQVRVA